MVERPQNIKAEQIMKYLIDVPPATVSGNLHMGHIFSYSHMDFIARYQQYIKGNDLVYPYCFDNNGLPTEKLAHKQNILNQEEIVDFSLVTSNDYQILFAKLAMGFSTHYYNTFSQTAIQLAELSFKDLVEKGYAYKADTEYFWCPVTKTSVSQNELTDDNRYERSGAEVEVRKGEGWFIEVKKHLPRIREAIDGINWHPEKFKTRLLRWLDDLKHDWSISRERNYGIPIPGEVGIVFDTWHTSSLSPQLAYSYENIYLSKRGGKLIETTLECPVFDVRFQAHDIIRTWALFTIIKSLYHNDQIPWRNIVISGHALDKEGRKISKSAGNFVHPDKYIERYGSDGVRYWTAQTQIGTDTKTDEKMMEKGSRLVNKIVNANKFLDSKNDDGEKEEYYMQWRECREKLNIYLEEFNWPEAIKELYQFFWGNFCDQMIESSKKEPVNSTLKRIFSKMFPYFCVFMPGLVVKMRK